MTRIIYEEMIGFEEEISEKVFHDRSWLITLYYPLLIHGHAGGKWDHIIDCGIHLGYYSLKYANFFNSVSSIDGKIRCKIDVPNVTTYEECLSHTVGNTVTWFEVPYDTAISTINKSYLWNNMTKDNFDQVETETKTTNTLDNLINKPVDLLKVDCEGSDADILMGAENLIKEYKPTIVADHQCHLVERFCLSLGYQKVKQFEQFSLDSIFLYQSD